MMRVKFPAACAIAALLLSQTAMAAQDSSYLASNSLSAGSARAVGAQIGITIKFGDRNTVPVAEKIRLGIAAGPIIASHNQTSFAGLRRTQPSFASLTLNPGRSISLSVVGQPLMSHYTALGAAESKKGPSGVGWVAIGAGVLLGLAAIGFAVISHDCNTGNGCDG